MTTQSLTPEVFSKRALRFGSLRAAQRALSGLAPVSDLEAMMAQGGELLVRLQALNRRASEPEQTAADLEALREVDRRLDEMSARTGAALDRISISQLRLTLKERADQHGDEIHGVLDVVLDGDLESQDRREMLEFLVTLVCTEDTETGRHVVHEPGDAAPRLAELAARFVQEDDPELTIAVDIFREAREKLAEEGAVADTRDRLRRYKQQIGPKILHPRVMSAVVHYNVAMSKRVEGLVQDNRSLDVLADDLLWAPDVEESPATATSVFDSAGFSRLVSALQARLVKEPCSDAVASRVVGAFELGGLQPVEIEAFERRDEDEDARLVRMAATLALTVRQESVCAPDLAELEIDPSQLKQDWRRELAQQMSARAHKLLAETRYVEASALSGIRAKNLAGGGRKPARRERPAVASKQAPSRRSSVLPGIAIAGVAVLAVALVFVSFGAGKVNFSRSDLPLISPFLESGRLVETGSVTRFVGELNGGWQYLDTAQRRAVTTEIGEHFRRNGVDRVVLRHRREEAARYSGGAIGFVAAGPNGS
jgi:hypothetical protein